MCVRAGVGKVDFAQDLERTRTERAPPGFLWEKSVLLCVCGTCRDDSLGELCSKTLKAVGPVLGIYIHAIARRSDPKASCFSLGFQNFSSLSLTRGLVNHSKGFRNIANVQSGTWRSKLRCVYGAITYKVVVWVERGKGTFLLRSRREE